jgi:hypothetical protein
MHQLPSDLGPPSTDPTFLSFSALLSKAPVPTRSCLTDDSNHRDGFEHPVEALAIQ